MKNCDFLALATRKFRVTLVNPYSTIQQRFCIGLTLGFFYFSVKILLLPRFPHVFGFYPVAQYAFWYLIPFILETYRCTNMLKKILMHTNQGKIGGRRGEQFMGMLSRGRDLG